MHTKTREEFLPFTVPLEGCVPWMYLDILGLVTVAVGVLVDPMSLALDLPFVRQDGAPASRDEIRAAWTAVKSRPHLAAQGHRVAARCTTIRLTDDGVRIAVDRRLDAIERVLGARFPHWDSWPWEAQLGTLSIAWACGPKFAFPKLAAALQARDWATAAVECAIREAGNPGIKPRNVATRALFAQAASAVAEPETLA